MSNMTVKQSFLDPDATYGPETIPAAIVDLSVISDVLQASFADGSVQDFGRWPGPDPVQIGSATINGLQQIHTIMTDGSEHLTGQIRFDQFTQAFTEGTGLHTESTTQVNYNDNVLDWFDEANSLSYSLSDAPKVVARNHIYFETETGVVVTATAAWSTAYQLYDTLNRKSQAGGWLSNGGAGATLTHTYPGPIAFRGYRFQNLRPDYWTRSYRIEITRNGTDWEVFHSKSVTDNSMQIVTQVVDEPIYVMAVRFIAESFTNAAGVGIFEVLVNGWGYVERFKPLIFDPDSFDVTETETEFQVSAKASTVVLPGTPLGIRNYCKVSAVPTGKVSRRDGKVGLNRIEFNSLGGDFNKPVLIVPPGKYRYRISAAVAKSVDAEMYLTVGASDVPYGEVVMSVGTAEDTTQPGRLTHVGEVTLLGDAPVGIHIKQDSLDEVMITSTEATLELWKLEDVLPIAPDLPYPPGVIGQSHNAVGINHDISDALNSDIANTAIMINPVMPSYFIYVPSSFTWHRTSDGSGNNGKVKIIHHGAVVTDLSSKHNDLTKTVAGEWEIIAEGLPGGLYEIQYDSADRFDAAWYFQPASSTVKVWTLA